MIEKYLIIAGSTLVVLLGTAHLMGTFFSDTFLPEDDDMVRRMKESRNKKLGDQNLFNAYIGFNASHSSGAMFFGLVNIILALEYFQIYQTSFALNALNLLCLFFLVFVANKYWFKIPFRGILLVTVLFVIANVVLWMN